MKPEFVHLFNPQADSLAPANLVAEVRKTPMCALGRCKIEATRLVSRYLGRKR